MCLRPSPIDTVISAPHLALDLPTQSPQVSLAIVQFLWWSRRFLFGMGWDVGIGAERLQIP